MKIGILAETKENERRTPLVPSAVLELEIPLRDICIESSKTRCYSDKSFAHYGANIVKDMSECEVLFGIKEIDKSKIMRGRTYFAFNHVGKGGNPEYLQYFVDKNCTLYDYEYLIDKNTTKRLLGFGIPAGIVGAFEALYSYGKIKFQEQIKSPFSRLNKIMNYTGLTQVITDLADIGKEVKQVITEPVIIAVSGTGRVAKGAVMLLSHINAVHIRMRDLENIKSPGVYLLKIDKADLYDAELMQGVLSKIDVFINGIYWAQNSPQIITNKMLKQLSPDYRLRVISDITCDVAGSIECNVVAKPIYDSIYYYSIANEQIIQTYEKGSIAIVSCDNLPTAIPEFSSNHFSKSVVEVINKFNTNPEEFESAKIVDKGKLTERFKHLKK